MTLDEMYQRVEKYTDENIGETPYTAEAELIDRFKTAINHAYQKICREKWFPETSEDVTLDSNLQFDTSSLTNTYNGLIEIKDSNGYEVTWEKVRGGSKIGCPYGSSGDTMTVAYRYIPAKMSELTDKPVFSEEEVDHLLMCYYAAYDYFVIEEEEERAENWFGRWAEGFAAITQANGEPQEVEEYW